jgi:hypothetical protein
MQYGGRVQDSGHARWPGYVVGLGVVIAAALPMFRSAQRDSFPLSTYPMFARVLDKPYVSFVERVDDRRRAHRLDPELVASDEVMQAYRTIKRAVRQGPEAAEELCLSIAQRLAKRENGKKDVRLRIVRARFDPIAYFVDDAEPAQRKVIASCTVDRKR